VLAPIALALALTGPAVAGAVEPGEAARTFETEAARLEAANDATQEAWQVQDGLVRDLLDEAAVLESAYADPDATADELRAIEARYEAALGAAYHQAKATIASRRRVYDQMDKLAALGRRIEGERRAVFDAPLPGGLWRMEIPGSDLVGIMQLDSEGGTVRGTYRLSNGSRGTVSGSYSGASHLELTRSDSAGGLDAALSGNIDVDRGTLEGTWVRFELGSGQPGSGTWAATRVSDESELPDLDE
jgi:hypothetical protein